MSWGQSTPAGWKRIRKQVLTRDAHTCQVRHACCTDEATEVHHLESITAQGMGRHDEGALDAEACVAICHACHVVETSRQSTQARWAKAHRTPRTHPADA